MLNLNISVCFFIAPILNVGLTAAVFERNKNVEIERNGMTGMDYVECVHALRIFRTAEIAGLIYYGWFTCPVYLARNQFLVDFAKVARDIYDNASQMKKRVSKKWLDFKGFRKIVGWWLCFAISMAVLLIATQFKWVFSVEYDDIQGKKICMLVSWKEGCQNFMLLLQPLFAVGGYEVCYVWDFFQDQFKKRISKLEDPNYVQDLQKVLEFMQLIRSEGPWLFTMLIWSILTLFVAMSLPPQYVIFWLRPGCHKQLVSTDLPEKLMLRVRHGNTQL